MRLTAAEAEALARMFRSELDRGWIPTASDLRAGLEILRERAEAESP